ncbi:MAG: phosphoribosyltransferase [Crenarchaeota archaeon]|nr:phosphoribosyltransferase [Thermoproteota archaeon]
MAEHSREPKKFLVLTWHRFLDMSIELAEKIVSSGKLPDTIVAVLRGGYFIAKILADYLGIDSIATIEVKFYKGIGERAERPIVVKPITEDMRDRDALIVDDVADSGRTLQVVADIARLHGARTVYTAALFYKPWSIIIPDYYVEETDKWIVFPWEVGETLRELSKEYGSLSRAATEIGIEEEFGKERIDRLIRIIEKSDKLKEAKLNKPMSRSHTTAPR